MSIPSREALKASIAKLLGGRDLTAVSLREFRLEIELDCGLEAGSLEDRKEELRSIVVAAMAPTRRQPTAGQEYGDDLEAEPEGSRKKMVYLITFSRPTSAMAADGTPLRVPSDFSRHEIGAALRHALLASQAGINEPINLVLMSVFLEQHSDGDAHYHVAVKASGQFRFLGVKSKLLQLYGLASHWSVTHSGYASAAGYCYLPSPRKPLAHLDAEPWLWAVDGQHPALEIATREAVNAKALATLREKARRVRAGDGKDEQRFSDVDIWPIVVSQNIEAGSVGREQLMTYAKAHGGNAMVKYLFTNWSKINELIDRAWQAECSERTVAEHGKTRLDYIHAAASQPCACGGRWKRAAEDLFARNGLDAQAWSKAMFDSLLNGRQKGNTVCHAGFEGDEGKSFLLQPLANIFGNDKARNWQSLNLNIHGARH
jgi:hypothetical protein